MQNVIPKRPGPANWHPHYEAVLNWVLANPHVNDSVGAAALGLTHPWFSMIINSDTFQERLQERARELGLEIGIRGIYQKMAYAANLALDETIKKFQAGTASETFVAGARNELLTKLGYSKEIKNESAPSQHVHYHAESLREARELLNRVGKSEVVEVNAE